MPQIEQRLVSSLQQHVREFLLQDLACVRCRAVAAGHLRGACGVCGGDLRLTLTPAVFRKRLTVFQGVARHHGFALLLEHATWALTQHAGGARA